MAVRPYKTEGKRFYVIGVTGWSTDMQTDRQASKPSTTFAVLDAADCHREVAIFYPVSGQTDGSRELRAQIAADELNAHAKGGKVKPFWFFDGGKAFACAICGEPLRHGRWLHRVEAGRSVAKFCWPGEGCRKFTEAA